jgi:type VI secretion system lysozyme-like protein
MPDPKPIEGGLALLFERLVDEHFDTDTVELSPLRVHDVTELKESVRRELERLLNTRCSVPSQLLGTEERTTLNYGIPDFSSLSAHSGDDQRHIAEVVATTIMAFEPRLREVYVEAERAERDVHSIRLRLEARLVVGTHAEPVSFTLHVHPKSGDAEAHENEPE